MGQSYSFASKILQDHALVLRDLAILSHGGLLDTVKHINKILDNFSGDSVHQILFAVKELSDENYLWKATVRIYCYKIEKSSGLVKTRKVLDLRQFCKVYRDVLRQVRCTKCIGDSEEWEQVDENGEAYDKINLEQAREALTVSMIITRVDEAMKKQDDEIEECCICLERQSDVILACVHCFCKVCIEKWSDSHGTCPVCRVEVKTDDSWEIPEMPSKGEIASYVMDLAEGAGSSTSN
ncbi:RING finger protein 141 [Exaiptasia diaphana]|uniref:RING finger protein 141 n=1 Tax=Exaiptasia diaphana TaxID=2652724 RepID=A0A913X6A6_EXADI|nr:RING finger protein 141 [Exaiptasia diaphana]KXJ27033.1 RING finger protein 141 [Exaiptasia diaphana]